MQSMLKTTQAASKGQFLKASTRAVALGTSADLKEPAAPAEKTAVPPFGNFYIRATMTQADTIDCLPLSMIIAL